MDKNKLNDVIQTNNLLMSSKVLARMTAVKYHLADVNDALLELRDKVDDRLLSSMLAYEKLIEKNKEQHDNHVIVMLAEIDMLKEELRAARKSL
jgi:hypothetical protein